MTDQSPNDQFHASSFLQGHNAEYVEQLYARYAADPSAVDEAWAAFTGDIGHWAVLGFGWFLVRIADAPEAGVVGSVGLHFPPAHAEVELAWNTFDGYRGKGYAPEAARAVLAWGRPRLDVPRLVSYINRANAASQAVARKLGATDTGTAPAHDRDCHIWVHAPTEGAA